MNKSILAALLFWFIIAPINASTDATEPHDLLRHRFEQQARDVIDSLDAVFGVVVKDLKTGTTFSANENIVFTQASVIKIPILVELYRQAEAGQFALDDTMTVKSDSVVGGAGILRHLSAGKVSMTVRDLAVMMIVVSDNTATNALIELVGMENVNRTMDELGFPETRLQRVMMDRQARLENRENISTPAETARLLEAILNEGILTPESCKDILDILSIAKNGRISRDLPSGARVANKPGSVGGVVNDAGIVLLEDRPFIVVAMASWNADRDAAEDAIAEISRLAYDYFERVQNSNRFGHRR